MGAHGATGRTPEIIAIAGGSCSGKSTLADALALQLGAAVLCMDRYYRELGHLTLDERAAANFDHPDALDYNLWLRHLGELARGRAIEAPTYDFVTHTRTAERARVDPAGWIVVEGLLSLHYPEARSMFALRAFVECPLEVCLARRLARDAADRGRTTESILRQWNGTVRPMYEAFVAPTTAYADVVVNGAVDVAAGAAAVLAALQARRED
jgi:uridine kinase